LVNVGTYNTCSSSRSHISYRHSSYFLSSFHILLDV